MGEYRLTHPVTVGRTTSSHTRSAGEHDWLEGRDAEVLAVVSEVAQAGFLLGGGVIEEVAQARPTLAAFRLADDKAGGSLADVLVEPLADVGPEDGLVPVGDGDPAGVGDQLLVLDDLLDHLQGVLAEVELTLDETLAGDEEGPRVTVLVHLVPQFPEAVGVVLGPLVLGNLPNRHGPDSSLGSSTREPYAHNAPPDIPMITS